MRLLYIGLAMVCVSARAAEISPKAKATIEATEKVLAEYEKAADECEKALAGLRRSTDPHVVAALDGADLRIAAVRSLRSIMARQPDYFAWHLGPAVMERWREGMKHFRASAAAGRDPYKGATSGVRGFRSPVDGQILFYVFRLPRDYDPAKRYPVDVGLHSGAGLTWRAGWIDGSPSNDPRRAAADQRIFISPCGRGNNSYAGMGEAAVMEAIRDVKRHYAVDENRITIGGASMGGTGGFRLATLHPDVFAAAHSLTGGPHYAVPAGNGRFDAMLLIDNLANTAMCIWDAPKEGHWKTNHAFAETLRECGSTRPGCYPVLELPDPDGGHGIINKKLIAEGWDWLRKQVRNPLPKRVVYRTYCLRYDGAYWARIDTVENPDAPARIEAEVDGGKLRVYVENADRFHLDLGKELVGDAVMLEAVINSGAALSVPAGKTVHFAKADGKWGVAAERYPAGLIKKHGLSGPVQDVFMEHPVLMVHAGDETVVDDAVGRLLGPGDGAHTLHTAFARKAAGEVTEQDIRNCNLVLFGTPKRNAMLARIADKLPAKFSDDGIEIAGLIHRGPDVGLIMVYPNPLNPERYVLLLPENYAGGSPWTYPDWLVVRKGAKQQVLAQGGFDSRWRPKP